MDMINQIYQMLLLSTVVTAKCACIKNTNVCFFRMYACKSGKLVNILTYVPILSYKNGVTIP